MTRRADRASDSPTVVRFGRFFKVGLDDRVGLDRVDVDLSDGKCSSLINSQLLDASDWPVAQRI